MSHTLHPSMAFAITYDGQTYEVNPDLTVTGPDGEAGRLVRVGKSVWLDTVRVRIVFNDDTTLDGRASVGLFR